MQHGELLAPGIAQTFQAAGMSAPDVSRVAVGVGPGPFTGLRVGVVTATTFAWARNIEVVGVCSLDIVAAAGVAAGLDEFVVATDARRKQVFFARYAGGQRVEGPIVALPDQVATNLPALGEGPQLYPEHFPHPASLGAEGVYPDAGVLAHGVAAGTLPTTTAAPVYLTRPDTAAPAQPKRVV